MHLFVNCADGCVEMQMLLKSYSCPFSCSWSGSWRCVRRRAESCRNMPTLFSSRLQTTALISWSRSSTPSKSLAENSDLRHNLSESRSPYLHPPKSERFLERRESRGHYHILLDSSSSCPSFYPATNCQDLWVLSCPTC